MIKEIISSISDALHKAFGADIDVYKEQVEQGLEAPCFLIRCLEPSMNRDLNHRFKKSILFSIQYFPETDKKQDECTEALEKLFDIMADLPYDGKVIHGGNMNGEITDGVLTFTISYEMFMLKYSKPAPTMDDLKVSEKG